MLKAQPLVLRMLLHVLTQVALSLHRCVHFQPQGLKYELGFLGPPGPRIKDREEHRGVNPHRKTHPQNRAALLRHGWHTARCAPPKCAVQ